MQSLEQLIDQQHSAWLIIKSWFEQAHNHYEILPCSSDDAGKELHGMQLSTRTPLGAIIYQTGGVLIHYGWLRLLGSGSDKLPRGMFEWNFGKSFQESSERPLFLLIADDILGGYFAINGGGIGDHLGNVYYFSPKTTAWQDMKFTYSEFLGWALNSNLEDFYPELCSPNWQQLVKQTKGNQVQHQGKPVPIERHYQDTFNPDDKYRFGYSVN